MYSPCFFVCVCVCVCVGCGGMTDRIAPLTLLNRQLKEHGVENLRTPQPDHDVFVFQLHVNVATLKKSWQFQVRVVTEHKLSVSSHRCSWTAEVSGDLPHGVLKYLSPNTKG